MITFHQNWFDRALGAIESLWFSPGNWSVHLAKNDFTWSPSGSAAMFTEADFPGYASQDNVDFTWGSPFINGSGFGQINATTVETFTCTGTPTPAQQIYGWYVLDDYNAGVVLYAEKFSAPITISASGQFVSLQPNLICKVC